MFEFTKKKYSSGENVWYQKINIGSIDLIIRENPDVDWDALMQDKTLRLPSHERWHYTFCATSSIQRHVTGIFVSKEEAAQSLLQYQHQTHQKSKTK